MFAQFFGVGEVRSEEGFVGGQGGEEVREPVCELVAIEWAWAFEEEEEGWSGEDVLVAERHGVHEAFAGVEAGVDFFDDRFDFGFADVATERAGDERSKEAFGVFFWGGTHGFERIVEPLVDVGAVAPVLRFATFGAGFGDGAGHEFGVPE